MVNSYNELYGSSYNRSRKIYLPLEIFDNA
jgi:hypothetical protein